MNIKVWREVAAIALALGLSLSSAEAQTSGLKIVVIEGEDAVNIIQQKTAVAPVVEVRDRNNQPVAGAVVRFAIQGGRASFNGARTLSVTTNVAGRAAVSGLTPTSSGAFQITASAAFQGQTAAATIAQTNVMTVAQAGAVSGGTTGAGAGGGGGGGLSATTLGVVGGAAAGGTLVAMKALPDNPVRTTYKGPFHLETVALNRRSINGVLVESCTWTRAFDGTLTVALGGEEDQSRLGNIKVEWTEQEVARTCPTPNPTGGMGGNVGGDLSGSVGNLQFSRENQQPAGTGQFDFVGVQAFSGALSGDVIVGTWTLSSLSTLVKPNTPGEEQTYGYPATSAPVTLQKQ